MPEGRTLQKPHQVRGVAQFLELSLAGINMELRAWDRFGLKQGLLLEFTGTFAGFKSLHEGQGSLKPHVVEVNRWRTGIQKLLLQPPAKKAR